MVVVAAFFGWVIRAGLESTSGDVYIHTIIPAYGMTAFGVVFLSTALDRACNHEWTHDLVPVNGRGVECRAFEVRETGTGSTMTCIPAAASVRC